MPRIEIRPAPNLTVSGGDTVNLTCAVIAGNPTPTVVWEREGNKPLNSSSDGVLVIAAASGVSQGKYICRATNILGSTEAVAFLIVQGTIIWQRVIKCTSRNRKFLRYNVNAFWKHIILSLEFRPLKWKINKVMHLFIYSFIDHTIPYLSVR